MNKPHINPEHPRIKNRSEEHQQYRDNLSKVLKRERSIVPCGKMDAQKMLQKERRNEEYIISSKGYTKEAADELIEKHRAKYLIENLEKFEGLNHQEIIDNLYKETSLQNFVKFAQYFDEENKKYMIKKLTKAQEQITIKK